MGKIVLRDVTGAYLDLWKATSMPGSQSGPKFGGNFIFDEDSPAYKAAMGEFMRVAEAKFGSNYKAFIAEMGKTQKCLRRGDANLDKDGVVRNGFAGKMFLVAKNPARPTIVDKDKSPLTEADGRIYSGCKLNISVDIYATDKVGQGKRVDATLLAVQFAGDGEAFGRSVGSADDFEDISDDVAEEADLF